MLTITKALLMVAETQALDGSKCMTSRSDGSNEEEICVGLVGQEDFGDSQVQICLFL